jgi:pyrroline-5-carboxylate reductase
MGTARSLMLVGGGKMGEALLGGLIARGWVTADGAVVVEPVEARRKELAGRYQGLSVHGSVEESVRTGAGPVPEGAVLAVKPADAEAACRALAPLGLPRVLSVAAGVTTSNLQDWLGGSTAVIRAMPNTPALIGAGAAAVAGGSSAGAEDVEWARAILEAVGTVVTVGEAALDAVTGLSGSGPAYAFLVAEALIDAGVLVGLTRPVARQLAVQTLLGSARMLAETGEEPSALRAQVTSPGGTTAAGLRALESAGVRAAILEAVAAATERSRQIGSA